jgi:hypothetical protein
MAQSYWSDLTRTRLNRRRALVAAGGAALGAAFLAACGSGSDAGEKKPASSLLSPAEDTSKKAVPGGSWSTSSGDALILDPTASNSSGAFEFSVPV